MANREETPRWKRWALEGAAFGAMPGFLRGLGPSLSKSEMAMHDVFAPHAPEFAAARKALNPVNLLRGIRNPGQTLGAVSTAVRNLPWREMANPGNLYNQTFFGPLPKGLMGQIGHGAGQLVRHGPQMAAGIVNDLGRGMLHDFGVPGAPKANSLLINIARAGVIARALAPIPGALYRAQTGPATEMENPQLTNIARATNAQRRLEESVSGLSLSLSTLRGRAVLP